MPPLTRFTSTRVLACFLLLAAAVPSSALTGIKPDGSLDKPAINKAYFEGEFETVAAALEEFRRSGLASHPQDSIYTYKYLSVVYAADPAARLKAESFMYQLIRMLPTIDLLDLYISDNIQGMFLKVKGDYEKIEKSKAAAAADSRQRSESVPAASYSAAAPKRSRLWVWGPIAIGGAGLATAAWFLAAPEKGGDGATTPRPVGITVEWPKEGSR